MEPNLESLTRAGTAVIADVFDAMGVVPPVLDNALFAVTGQGTVFAGPAYTISGQSSVWTGSGDRAKLEAIDRMPRGVVPVWAGNDIRGVCCFGDLLAEAMRARGCVGVVVDGGVRDTSYLRTLGLPVVARYRTPAQAIGRWRVIERDVPVRLRGAVEDWVTVSPEDIVVVDEDGAVVIPRARLSEVFERVVEYSRSESGARADIRAGLPLLAALEKYGHL